MTEYRRYDRTALNGTFREIILEPEEPMNKETQHLIRYVKDNKIINGENKTTIRQLIIMYYSNSISYLSDIIAKEIIKTYIKFNDTEGDKYNLSINLIISYEMLASESKADATFIGNKMYDYYDYEVKGDFDDKKKIIKLHFNTDISKNLNSINMIKEYAYNEILYFMNNLEETLTRSDLVFYKINQIIIQLSKSKKTKAGSYFKTPDILKYKHAIVNIKNTDDKYLEWCLLAYKHYEDINNKDKNDPKHYKKMILSINMIFNTILKNMKN